MTSKDYKRYARDRAFETGESYAEALLQVRSNVVKSHLNGKEIDVPKISKATGLRQHIVRNLLGYLAHQRYPQARPCDVCASWGAYDECERCSAKAHPRCLETVAGRQVCEDCAEIMEGSGL